MHEADLKSLSDDALLVRLVKVSSDSKRIESELVAHIAEVDARKLYVREASPSMHKYCVDVLRLSDAEAYFRITAARASRRHPVLLKMLGDGRLHLSGIEVLAPHLKELSESERDALLTGATYKTKRELQELVAELAPKPDVPARIRRVPERRLPPKRTPTSGRSKPRTLSGESSRGPLGRPRDERKRVEPLSPARYKVQFTASASLRDKLERLSALMPHEELASVIESAVTEKLERLEAKRYGRVKKPKKDLADADRSPGVRGITAPVKRFVWDRDGGQCTFESADGGRCPERRRLEFHHDDPYARGGDRSPDNVRLLCKPHNLYLAEMDYGKEKMSQYRRSDDSDRVREPGAALLALAALHSGGEVAALSVSRSP